jgi:hypothetical protein
MTLEIPMPEEIKAIVGRWPDGRPIWVRATVASIEDGCRAAAAFQVATGLRAVTAQDYAQGLLYDEKGVLNGTWPLCRALKETKHAG